MSSAAMPVDAGREYARPLVPAGVLAESAAARFEAVCFKTFADVSAEWAAHADQGAGSPFQQARWLEAWYSTAAMRPGVEPLIIRVSAPGGLAAILPLVRVKRGVLSFIEFADCGITDYNAPLLGPTAPEPAEQAAEFWAAVRAALPRADIIDFAKMPLLLRGRRNPLAALDGVTASDLIGNSFEVKTSWAVFRHGLARTFRKEIERSWRVFLKHEGAEFKRITDPVEAEAALDAIERLQRERIQDLGLPYVLDDMANSGVYREAMRNGLADGSVVITIMRQGDDIAAALLGLSDGKSFAMIRLAIGGARWKNCSPGRLILDGSMALMREQGITHFDFTIGDYPFKRRLGAGPVPLADYAEALTWLGLPLILKRRARRWLKQQDFIRNAVRRQRGKAAVT